MGSDSIDPDFEESRGVGGGFLKAEGLAILWILCKLTTISSL